MKRIVLDYIKDHDFLRHNVVFLVGSLVIAGFNYLYYPVVGRLVSVSNFGQIQAIISIFMQLGILLTAFGYVVTNIINNEKSRESSEVVVLRLERLTMIIACILLACLSVGSYFLKSGLQFSSSVPFIMVGLLVLLNVPSTTRTYVLQGRKRLRQVSISGIIFASSKLIISVALIIVGLNVVGVMSAYILAQTLTLWYLLRKTKNDFPSIRQGMKSLRLHILTTSQKVTVKNEVFYGGAIIILLFSTALLCSFDVVVARMFLSSVDAGLYSGISAIARIVYFVTASVAGVLIATVKLQDGYATSREIMAKSMAIVAAIGGVVTLVFSLAPSFVVNVLMGTSYSKVAYLLPTVSLLMLICSFNNLFVCFQIARRRYRAIIAIALGLCALVVSLYYAHSGFYDIIYSYLISNIVVFVVLLVQIIKKGVDEK